jgi:predicted dehydrogenase
MQADNLEQTVMKGRLGILIVFAMAAAGTTGESRVRFVEKAGRIDVLCDGKLFTSYRYADSLAKPALSPVRSPSGIVVTRGFPLDPSPGETTDHPHHTGLFFAFDDVNGNGFWNHAKPPPVIRHVRVTDRREDGERGILRVESAWISASGKPLLREERTMVFRPWEGRTTADFSIRLTAIDTTVTFRDSKEGLFAIRVADWLREDGGTGRFLNSSGAETEKNCWGRRADWTRLEGERQRKRVGIAVFNHPGSVNYPAYFLTRGYGLFSCNPLAQKVAEEANGNPGAAALNLTLGPGREARFAFRLMIYEGGLDVSSLDAEFKRYAETDGEGAEPVRLMILDPGHFHAALVLKTESSRTAPAVDVYAPVGPELEDFLGRVRGYNARAEKPTHWDLRLHVGPDFFTRLLREKPGDAVVISGNNARKAEFIRSCAEAGLNVLADKPMCIDRPGFRLLETAFRRAAKRKAVLYDIMTERYEITNLLQKELMHIPSVFGSLEKGSAGNPAVVKQSVHHFSKIVSGSPVRRPAWFFDTAQQGEGIVDVTTHLTDLVQWECFPEEKLNYRIDIRVRSGKRWPTVLSADQFRKVTGLEGFPGDLASKCDSSGSLPVFSNGEIVYRIKGHWARVSVLWNFEAPPGGGDTHFSVARGTRSNLVIRQSAEQSYKPELYVEPVPPESTDALESALAEAVRGLAARFPGLGIVREGEKWRVTIPESYRVGHEAHFGQVADTFLSWVTGGRMPEWEVPCMLAKYYTTTTALEMARKAGE